MPKTHTYRTASLLVALSAIVVLALPAVAGEDRPFKGRGNEAIVAAAPDPDGLLVTTVGSGLATHLGKFTREVTAVIHPDFTVEGTITFTAANGDLLVADLAGGFTGPTTLAGTYAFTGGTGRFAHASGTATFDGVTLDGIHVDLTFGGNIQY